MTNTDENIVAIRQSSPQKKIVALMKKFPGFYSVVPGHILHGSINFNDSAFDKWASGPLSKGQRIIAKFILGVYDQYSNDQWECGKFDIFEAAGVLSSDNLNVIAEWVKKPFFV